jgi:hypothetical protein
VVEQALTFLSFSFEFIPKFRAGMGRCLRLCLLGEGGLDDRVGIGHWSFSILLFWDEFCLYSFRCFLLSITV